MGWGWLWGSVVVSIPSYNPCPLLSLIPAFVLCCAHLQEPEQGHFSQKCAARTLYGLFSSHILFFLSVLLPTILGCYHQQFMVGSIWLLVSETNTLALLSPKILQAVTFLQLWSIFVVVSVVRMFRDNSVFFIFMIAIIKIIKFLRSQSQKCIVHQMSFPSRPTRSIKSMSTKVSSS